MESKLGRTGNLSLGLGSLLGPELLPSQARDLASLEPPESSWNPQPIQWSQASTPIPSSVLQPSGLRQARPGHSPAHRFRNTMGRRGRLGGDSSSSSYVSALRAFAGSKPGPPGAQHGLHRDIPQLLLRAAGWPQGGRPAQTPCVPSVTGHACEPAPLCPIPAAGPHLLGLSLRLVLRALKLSFSGVSSKDRRTLERRPWQSGADLSHRPPGTEPCVSSLQEPGLHTCRVLGPGRLRAASAAPRCHPPLAPCPSPRSGHGTANGEAGPTSTTGLGSADLP